MEESSFLIDIEITNLKHVKTKKNDAKGNPQNCIILPLELNGIKLNSKGNGYIIPCIMRPVKDQKPNQRTHTIRLNVSKEAYAALTEEEKKAIPWLGSGKRMEETHARPIGNTPPPQNDSFDPEEDDLPF